MNMSRYHWWKGARGEWYVLIQFVLVTMVIFGPRTCCGLPEWKEPFVLLGSMGGGMLMVAGSLLAVAGLLNLGKNLTPLPRPKDTATLIETGAYRLVRHPIYGGIILSAFGWSLWVHSLLTICYATTLLMFFEIKSNREEQWLMEKFPEYSNYRRRIRKFIPFLY